MEILIFIVFTLLLIAPQLIVKKLAERKQNYISIISSIVILIIVWALEPYNDNKWKWILTILAVISLIKNLRIILNNKVTSQI